jgi:hypothetical protein
LTLLLLVDRDAPATAEAARSCRHDEIIQINTKV